MSERFRKQPATRPAATQGASRFVGVLVVLAIVVLVLCVASLAIGAQQISFSTILHLLSHPDPTRPESSVLWDRRIPRTILALLAGSALGVAGVFIQALTRNPLADTGVLGINSGAAFTALLGIAFLGLDRPLEYLGAALIGAILASAMVYSISRGRAMGVDPVRLVLAGVALSAILNGIGEGLSLVNPQAFDRLRSWMMGSVDVGSYAPVLSTAVAVGVGLVVAGLCAPQLNALVLGDDTAIAVGAQVDRIRFISFTVVVLLAASATAAVGVIAFLGLVVPHVSRWLVGAHFVRIFFASVLLGPAMLLLADIIGRVIVAGEFPAGVVVSFIGAPFLIAYAQTAKRGLA